MVTTNSDIISFNQVLLQYMNFRAFSQLAPYLLRRSHPLGRIQVGLTLEAPLFVLQFLKIPMVVLLVNPFRINNNNSLSYSINIINKSFNDQTGYLRPRRCLKISKVLIVPL